MCLLKMWLMEIKWAKRYYDNGLSTYFSYKFGLINSPTLGRIINTFKGDVIRWKSGEIRG